MTFKVKDGIAIAGSTFVDGSRNVQAGTIDASNATLTGELRGPASFVIDPAGVGDNTGTVIIRGNLQVDGSTTTINSTTLSVDDLNIVLADGAANAAAANGAGLTVAGSNATFTYTSSDDRWNLNKNLNVSTVFGALSGNASTASAWQTARTLSFTGDATGSMSVNGSADVSAALTLANSGVTAGTYTKVTVDAKGRVTTGTTLASADLPTYTGTISSSQVTTALGFTPYNSTNPSGYITNTGNARVGVENNGTLIGTRRNINFIPGSGISLSISDDSANEEVDVTISSSISSVSSVSATTSTGIQTSFSSSINTTTPGTGYYGINFSGGGSADFAQGITWAWSSSGAQAGVYVQSSGAYGTKMYLATTDSFATGAKTAVTIDHGGNVSLSRGSFSTPTTWINYSTSNYNGYNENIRLYPAGNNVSVIAFGATGTSGTPWNSILGFSDRFEIRQGDQWQERSYANYMIAYGSYRAPIFYDSDNTAYYIDPNSTSRIRKTNLVASGSGWDDGLNLYSSDETNRWNLLVDNGASDSLRIAYNNSEAININTSRNVTVNVDVRSPIYYDSNDTTYYLDPNSYSRIRQLTLTQARVDASKYPVGHYAPGEEVFAIDPTWTQDQLREYFNSNNVSWVADSTAPGGYAIQISGSTSVGGVYGAGFPYIPVETDDTFYMEVYIKDVTGSNGHYMGSMDFNHNFSNLGGNPGSFGYWVMANSFPGTGWTKYSGYISGFGTSTGQFVSGTKYWTPQALFNYSGGGTSYISGWKVLKLAKGIVGRFPQSQNNTGEAWWGRANDRNRGTFTIQLGGGTSSGRQFEVVDHAWTSVMFRVDSGNYSESAGSSRAPIFYDSNNTGYYLDPNSTTSLRTVGSWRSDSSSWDGEFAGKIQYHSNNWYLQYAGQFIFRNSGGSNVFYGDTSGNTWAISSSRAPIFYDTDNTGYYFDGASTSKWNESNQDGWHTFNNYGLGVTGTYVSTRLQTVFAMGSSYRMSADGSATNNMYGIAWSHPNAGSLGGANNLNDHGMLIINNGSFRAAISSRAVFSQDVRGTLFYDYNNTAYYVDPNGSTAMFSDGVVVAGQQGFQSRFYSSGRNRIWSFNNADAYGLSYFQGAGGYASSDSIGIHFGSAVADCNFIFRSNSDFIAKGNVTAYSDARLKTNITRIENALEKVCSLNGYTYDRTDIETSRQTGVIAQEVLEVLPEAVTGNENTNYSVAYGNMVGLLIEAIKEQQSEIDELKSLVKQLLAK